MAENGLKRGVNGLQVYVMCEIPSNVILADEFAERFDGFSIGSNDLTQLTLGVDRDSGELAGLFDEEDEAVEWMIGSVIRAAHKAGAKVGLCGQAPSDHPGFAEFLVGCGIDSISVSPDSFLAVKAIVAKSEKARPKTRKRGRLRARRASELLRIFPMIEQLQGFPGDVVGFACKGFVTRRDYEDVLVPAVERALKTHDKLRLYYEIDPEFTGIEPGAMWEDFKVGVEHLLRWERIAVVTDIDWIAHSHPRLRLHDAGARCRVFPLKEAAEAREWLVSESG